mgnify:CR=1 FL=1
MRCVIISDAIIKDYEKVRSCILQDDFVIFCDGGLCHLEKLGVKPDLIVGDFDSHEKPSAEKFMDSEIIQLPCEKDDTDTFFAVKEAVKRGFDDFLLVGVIGQRFDHSLVNISILMYLFEKGFTAKITDDYSEMEIIGKEPVKISDSYSCFSLLCIDGNVSGVTIKNAKYPLDNAEITTSYQYGISNEVLPGLTAEASVKNGKLLLIKNW